MTEFLAHIDWLAVLLWSVTFFVGGLILMAVVVYFLSEDYFISTELSPIFRRWPLLLILSNATGVVLILLGGILFLVPGPGALTLLLGVSLIQSRKKHQLIARLGRRKAVRQAVNAMRSWMGRTPMKFHDSEV